MEKVIVNYLTEYKEPDYDIPAPPQGKAWRNKISGAIYLSGIILGKLSFLDGKHLEVPVDEKPEDYELIDGL